MTKENPEAKNGAENQEKTETAAIAAESAAETTQIPADSGANTADSRANTAPIPPVPPAPPHLSASRWAWIKTKTARQIGIGVGTGLAAAALFLGGLGVGVMTHPGGQYGHYNAGPGGKFAQFRGEERMNPQGKRYSLDNGDSRSMRCGPAAEDSEEPLSPEN